MNSWNSDNRKFNDTNVAYFILKYVCDDLEKSPFNCFSGGHTTTTHSKVKLSEANHEMVIDNPPFSDACFSNSRALTIPYHNVLAIDIKFDSCENLNGKQKNKISDSVGFSLSVSTSFYKALATLI